MLRLPLLLVTGIALLATTTVPASGDDASDAVTAKSTHTLSIDYQQTRGDMRRAMLKIAPKDEGARPLWRGDLERISVLTTGNGWIIIESFGSSGRTTGVEAQAMLPAPGHISAIILHPKRGTPIGWKVEEGEGYTEVEWTYLNQQGREIPPPAPLEANGDDDDCGPIPAGCEVYNPYTCECDIGLKDPFEKSLSGERVVLDI